MHYAPPGHGSNAGPAFPYAVEKYGQLYLSAGTPIALHACAKCGAASPSITRTFAIRYAPDWIIFALWLFPFVTKVRRIEVALCPRCDSRARSARLQLLLSPLVLLATLAGVLALFHRLAGAHPSTIAGSVLPLGLLGGAGCMILLHYRLKDVTFRLNAVEELLEVPAPRGTEAHRISGLHPSIVFATCHAAAAAWHHRAQAFTPAHGQSQGYGARTL